MPKSFDPTNYRDDPKAIAKYLNDALSSGDPVLKAIGELARAQGATAFSRKIGINRAKSLQRI